MPESNALLSVHDYADDRIRMHGRRERGAESGARPGAGLGDWRGLPNILQPGSRLAAVSWALRLSCSVRVVGLLWLVFLHQRFHAKRAYSVPGIWPFQPVVDECKSARAAAI